MPFKILLLTLSLAGIMTGDSFASAPLTVSPAPDSIRGLQLEPGLKIIDFDISRSKPEAIVLLSGQKKGFTLLLWDIAKKTGVAFWKVPKQYQPSIITVHPDDSCFFLLAKKGPESVILRLPRANPAESREIFTTKEQLRRLVVGPRPFETAAYSTTPVTTYRLFFGVWENTGDYSINTITEQGKLKYQMMGPNPKPEEATALDSDYKNLSLSAESALPLGFHPGGDMLLWNDAEGCFHRADYGTSTWSSQAPLFGKKICGGTVTVTPNGLGVLHWRKDRPGVTLYLNKGTEERILASSHTFAGTPSSTPDGKGLVGEVRDEKGRSSLVYVPVSVPLADVANAWMFAPTSREIALFKSAGGLFRELKDPQLYNLYESEFYTCRDYDSSLAARPYLVTTDLFWEVFAAAFEGLLIRVEQDYAMPAFKSFVDESAKSFTDDCRLARVFKLLQEINNNAPAQKGGELDKIIKAAGPAPSELLGEEQFSYDNLVPNGHYSANQEKQRYFKAFRYLSMIELTAEERTELQKLPKQTQDLALAWINSYKPFVAQPRAPGLWQEEKLPDYLGLSKKTAPTLFPLSWGLDNEILNSTVYHEDWPEDQRVEMRWLPSALDVAAVLGSSLAETLLEKNGEFKKYSRLKPVLSRLKKRLAGQRGGDNLYDRWIGALAVQWNEAALKNKNFFAGATWEPKRLQTGLASWATLRHATVLVNARVAAECGEGGFEAIVMEKPRGYVEPDPATFEAIAGLFAAAVEILKTHPVQENRSTQYFASETEMKNGLLSRLKEAHDKTLLFAKLARKELAGQPLTEKEYDEIHYVARTIEYNFLVFKSLANKDLGFSEPDPMPKIADIGGGKPSEGLRLAAVGFPLEWDAMTPYFGRRQIARGAVYSFHELTARKIWTDQAWLKALGERRFKTIVDKFFSAEKLSCPPVIPF